MNILSLKTIGWTQLITEGNEFKGFEGSLNFFFKSVRIIYFFKLHALHGYNLISMWAICLTKISHVAIDIDTKYLPYLISGASSLTIELLI